MTYGYNRKWGWTERHPVATGTLGTIAFVLMLVLTVWGLTLRGILQW